MKDHLLRQVEIDRYWNGHGWTDRARLALPMTQAEATQQADVFRRVSQKSGSPTKRTYEVVPAPSETPAYSKEFVT